MPDLLRKLAARSSTLPTCVELHMLDGDRIRLGTGEPALQVYVRNPRGERAVRSLNQLAICDAYIAGDIDFEGDLIAGASLQRVLPDRQLWVRMWRHLQPLLLGRAQCNPAWIAKHYDSNNIQLVAADREYHTYTPGAYESDSDSLESGARRKLERAYCALKLGEGREALDVGFGWGGFLRFCARQGVKIEGITLSRHQFDFVKNLLAKEALCAQILHQDFFTYQPRRQFDGVSMMGVLEDLSDYTAVFRRLVDLVKPGGRVYLDFATASERFGTSSFITKYVWPGQFRMVYLPELMAAIAKSPFEIIDLQNDRRNYFLWAKESYRRWMLQKSAVVERAGEALWRMFHVMHAGTTSVMGRPDSGVSAYRMLLELRPT